MAGFSVVYWWYVLRRSAAQLFALDELTTSPESLYWDLFRDRCKISLYARTNGESLLLVQQSQ